MTEGKALFKKNYIRVVVIGLLISNAFFLYLYFTAFCFLTYQEGPKLSLIQSFLNHSLFKEMLMLIQIPSLFIATRMGMIPQLKKEDNPHGSTVIDTVDNLKKKVYTWDLKSDPPDSGIFLGLTKKKEQIKEAYFDCSDVHSIIIAATRSGKTRKILLPTIMQIAYAGNSMVINDPKGENFLITGDFLRSKGYRVVCIDFREPLKSNQWNPLFLIVKYLKEKDESKAVEAAWDLSIIICPSNQLEDNSIFAESAQSLLAGAMLYLCMEADLEEEKNMSSLNELLFYMSDQRSPFYLDNIVRSLPSTHPAKKALYTCFSSSGNLRTSIFANAQKGLRLFADSGIEQLCEKQDHDMSALGREKTALFIILPDEKTTRHPMAVMYTSQLYQVLTHEAFENGGRLSRKVHFLFDEFGNTPVQPDFPQKITVGAGRGILYTLVVQSLEQLQIYGIHGSNTIIGNAGNWLFLSTNNPETAEVINKKIGTETIVTNSIRYQSAMQTEGQETVQMIERDKLKTEELLRWKTNQVIVLRQGEQPIILDILDFSKYPFNEYCGMTGDEMTDIKIMNHRNHMRREMKIESPKIWKPKNKKNSDRTGSETSPMNWLNKK